LEVQEIIEVDIEELFSPDSLITRSIYLQNGSQMEVPGYRTGRHIIWGATAMIFSEFQDLTESIIR
jgi:hypothetical protein